MNKRNDSVRETVINVIVVIIGLFALELAATLLFIGGGIGVFGELKMKVMLGLTAGSFIGIGMFLHMKKTLEASFAFGEKSAPAQVRKSYVFRIAVVGILLFLAAWSGWFDILALILGVMNLKIAVYLQPILHIIFHRKEDTR